MRFFVMVFLALLAPAVQAKTIDEQFGGREITLVLPQQLQSPRALVVALHGGGGNARFMQNHLGLDSVAEKYGFLVAYLNGSEAGLLIGARMHAWNSGAGCCGLPARNNVDDIGYISGAVAYLAQKYGVAPDHIFVTGHSNGSMMAQRMLCETNLFAAGVTLSGPLNPESTQCPGARGKRVLAFHGAEDENVPIAGGKGTKGPMKVQKNVVFASEAYAKQRFEAAGASYTLDIIAGVDHSLERQDEALQARDGKSLGEKEAEFFGLAR